MIRRRWLDSYIVNPCLLDSMPAVPITNDAILLQKKKQPPKKPATRCSMSAPDQQSLNFKILVRIQNSLLA